VDEEVVDLEAGEEEGIGEEEGVEGEGAFRLMMNENECLRLRFYMGEIRRKSKGGDGWMDILLAGWPLLLNREFGKWFHDWL